ncbi:MAG: hypothetical protein V1494_01020 [Candidatus Diapherotrites archaeon]
MNGKAQISTEAIGAIAFVVLLLIVIGITVSDLNAQKDYIEQTTENQNECKKISETISLFTLGEGREQMTIWMGNTATVSSGSVTVGESYCHYFGEAYDAILSAGSVRVYDENGVVKLENI